jgi:hypothetical protein
MSEIELIEKSGYDVMPCGAIFSSKTNRLLSASTDSYGYKVVGLSIDGKLRTKKVHRLVALKYLNNPIGKPQVNHKNGVKTDNNISNLEWATNLENQRHAVNTGLRDLSAVRAAASLVTSKPVIDLNTGVFYSNVRELAALLGVKNGLLYAKLSNRNKNNTPYIYC